MVAAPVVPAGTVIPSGPGSFSHLGVPQFLCGPLAVFGLSEPFPIQTATLPDSLSGRDVLGQGRTGSGKTLAFALPIVARLAANTRRPGDMRPRALVLVPTRELAAQVAAVIAPLAAAAGMRTATIFGGVGAGPQIAALRAGTEIIVGCPGRLLDHLGTGALDLRAIEITVLDEADHMADVGFLPMVIRLLDATPATGQRMLFSATLAGGVDKVVNKYLSNPVSHAVATEAPVLADHHVMVCLEDDRLTVLSDLAQGRRVVVFTRTKHRAKQITKRLAAAGLAAVELHGNLSQNARTANLEAFSNGKASLLIATDIAARGIHVDDVPLVIHCDPPIEHKAYLHRSGRTARAGAAGTVVTLSSREQVHAVKDLMRLAKVEPAWSQLPPGGQGSVAALDGKSTMPFSFPGYDKTRSSVPAPRGGGRNHSSTAGAPRSNGRGATPDANGRARSSAPARYSDPSGNGRPGAAPGSRSAGPSASRGSAPAGRNGGPSASRGSAPAGRSGAPAGRSGGPSARPGAPRSGGPRPARSY
jgi:superfamily II DNA/RNA helicase